MKTAAGLHLQPHEYVDLFQRSQPERAKPPYIVSSVPSVQAVVGWEWYMPAGLTISVEAYEKVAEKNLRIVPELLWVTCNIRRKSSRESMNSGKEGRRRTLGILESYRLEWKRVDGLRRTERKENKKRHPGCPECLNVGSGVRI